jgi:hypothetical protein
MEAFGSILGLFYSRVSGTGGMLGSRREHTGSFPKGHSMTGRG